MNRPATTAKVATTIFLNMMCNPFTKFGRRGKQEIPGGPNPHLNGYSPSESADLGKIGNAATYGIYGLCSSLLSSVTMSWATEFSGASTTARLAQHTILTRVTIEPEQHGKILGLGVLRWLQGCR
jgi:hypothetical protein